MTTRADRGGAETGGYGSLARQALHRCGGAVGLLMAAAPTVAFVVANAVAGLTVALVVLGATATVTSGVRLLRGGSTRAAVGGVAVAALFAGTAAVGGEARGFFLVPTIMPAVLAVVSLVSVAVRRPVTGLLLNRAVGGPPDWPRHRRLLRVHSLGTLAATAVNVVNFAVHTVLYLDDRVAALAVVHIAVWPVFAVLVSAVVVAARRAATDIARAGPAGVTPPRAGPRCVPG